MGRSCIRWIHFLPNQRLRWWPESIIAVILLTWISIKTLQCSGSVYTYLNRRRGLLQDAKPFTQSQPQQPVCIQTLQRECRPFFLVFKGIKQPLMAWEREGVLQLGCLLRECFWISPELVDLQSYPINSLPDISPSIAETSISTLLVRLLLFCEGLIRLWHGHMLLLFQPPESS